MTPSVQGETRNPHEELLIQLRDLMPSAFLGGERDRYALLGALGLDEEAMPAISFRLPGIERDRQDARIPTTATLIPDSDVSLRWPEAHDVLARATTCNYTTDKHGLLIGGAGGDD